VADWLDDLADAGIAAVLAKFGPKPEHEVFVTPVSYRVTIMPGACLRHRRSDLHWWNLCVQPVAALYYIDSDGWLVTNEQQYVLGRDGLFHLARGDDAADREWLANCVRPSFADALDAARDFAPKVTLNDLTAVEVLARHRARGMECCAVVPLEEDRDG
jgi:hypothetical protein